MSPNASSHCIRRQATKGNTCKTGANMKESWYNWRREAAYALPLYLIYIIIRLYSQLKNRKLPTLDFIFSLILIILVRKFVGKCLRYYIMLLWYITRYNIDAAITPPATTTPSHKFWKPIRLIRAASPRRILNIHQYDCDSLSLIAIMAEDIRQASGRQNIGLNKCHTGRVSRHSLFVITGSRRATLSPRGICAETLR